MATLIARLEAACLLVHQSHNDGNKTLLNNETGLGNAARGVLTSGS
jgi:hypothetical protein